VKLRARKWPVFAASALLVAACAIAVYCSISSFIFRLRIAFAEEQTAIFDEMRMNAEASDVSVAVDCLQSTVTYYPSGTKQVKESRLDRIVERARQNAVREIISALRRKTGADYGDDPQRWIRQFSGDVHPPSR
jgi:hypothetical protein